MPCSRKAEPQPKIIEAMTKPAEKSLAWWEYRARFLNDARIDAGARLWREHRELLDAIAMERHVQPEYVLGILGVETYFGRLMGRYRVLDALSHAGLRLSGARGLLPQRARAVSAAHARRRDSIR